MRWRLFRKINGEERILHKCWDCGDAQWLIEQYRDLTIEQLISRLQIATAN